MDGTPGDSDSQHEEKKEPMSPQQEPPKTSSISNTTAEVNMEGSDGAGDGGQEERAPGGGPDSAQPADQPNSVALTDEDNNTIEEEVRIS